MASTRRGSYTCGKLTHRLICGGISGQRTQKQSSLPGSHMCQHVHLLPNYANRPRPSQQYSGARLYNSQELTVHAPSQLQVQWHHVGSVVSTMVGLFTYGNQPVLQIRALFWRASLCAQHCPRVPLRLCRRQIRERSSYWLNIFLSVSTPVKACLLPL